MTLIIDAGPLYRQADRDPDHATVTEVLRSEPEALVSSAFAVAEADSLILSRLGVATELSFSEDLASGTYGVESLTRRELRTAHEVALAYRDLQFGNCECFSRRVGAAFCYPPAVVLRRAGFSDRLPPCKAVIPRSCPPTFEPTSAFMKG